MEKEQICSSELSKTNQTKKKPEKQQQQKAKMHVAYTTSVSAMKRNMSSVFLNQLSYSNFCLCAGSLPELPQL